MDAKLTMSELRKQFDLTDATVTLRDPSRCEFRPEQVTVVRRETPWWVTVRGRRVKSGHYTQVGYGLREDGTVMPHDRLGEAPDWLVKLVAAALQGDTWVRVSTDVQPEAMPAEWYAMHDHGDGVGGHQHFTENGGHGSHEGVALVPYAPLADPAPTGF